MILVSGGTGAIGSRLVRGLVEAGNKIRILTLPGDPYVDRVKDLPGVEILFADVSKAETLAGKFDGVRTVYHLAAVLLATDPSVFDRVNVGGTKNMIDESIKAGVEHFILVSSASVFYPVPTAYSLSKKRKEELIKSQDRMKWTIIRPTLAYSPIGGEEFLMFRDYLLRYKWFVPFIGAGNAKKNPVHTDDLMKGFLAVANNPAAWNKEYNFSGGEVVTIRELARLILKHSGRRTPILGIPVFVCKFLSWLSGMFSKKPKLTWSTIAGIIFDADLDNGQARKDLGYNPIGVREGLAKCFPLPAGTE